LRTRRNALSFSQENLRFLRAAAAAANLACDVLHVEAQPSAEATPEPEELAMQCSRCGRVEVWALRQQPCACGGEWERAAVPKVLARRFTVVRRLGAGGMGVAYAAMDTTLGRDVALKTLPRLAGSASARLLVEARTMARLSHPAIAVIYGTEVWRDTPVLVMEYLAGGTLATRLLNGPLDVAETVRIASALASTLEHVHNAGMYHGDIKPSNIGFTADGAPKFLDFGLSTTIRGSQPTDDTGSPAPAEGQRVIAGTFAYMSPEVREGAPAGPALDVWALSVVLCEMVLGRHPFAEARSAQEIARGVSKAIATLDATGSSSLCQFLAGALATSPHRSPTTARDLLSALGALS
jgi:serine/threonine protein kinase